MENWPTNWDKGFDWPYVIAGGGSEIPFRNPQNNHWMIYVWNAVKHQHGYYDYNEDIFYLEDRRG